MTVSFTIFKLLWNALLILGFSFVLFCLITYPFQRRWLSARIRVDEWLKGKYFRGTNIAPPEFSPVGNAVTELAQSLKKLIKNHRNTRQATTLKSLRKEAHDLVISIAESTSAILDHWKMLGGMDLVEKELAERASLDTKNLTALRENLDTFRASFQKAAVSQSSEALSDASDRLTELSHFARLMSESIDTEN